MLSMCSSVWCSTFCREPRRLQRTSGRGSPRPRHSTLRDLPSFTVTGPGGITDTVGAPGGGGHQRGDGDTTAKDAGMAIGTPPPWGHLEYMESVGMRTSQPRGHLEVTSMGTWAPPLQEHLKYGEEMARGTPSLGGHLDFQHGAGDTITPGASGACGGHQRGDGGREPTTPGAPEAWRGHGDGDTATLRVPRAHGGYGDRDTGTPPPQGSWSTWETPASGWRWGHHYPPGVFWSTRGQGQFTLATSHLAPGG